MSVYEFYEFHGDEELYYMERPDPDDEMLLPASDEEREHCETNSVK
jgi:hypothetical protein